MSKMLIPACYPGSATRNLRAKSPYEADFPSQTFQSIISAQPERAEVRKLLLQIVCCLASTLTPSVAGFLLITSNKTIFPFYHNLPATSLSRLIIPSNEHLSFTHLLVGLTDLMMDILGFFSMLKADLDKIISDKEA